MVARPIGVSKTKSINSSIMRATDTSPVTFTPGVAGVGTLDFSALSGFDSRRLYLVNNQTRNTPIYATGTTGKGATSITGSVITLASDTSSMSSSDILQVLYDNDTLPVSLDEVGGKAITLGQKPLSASLPVAIASDEQVPIINGDTVLSDSFGYFNTSNWTIAQQASGDIISFDGNAICSGWLAISLDPFASNTTTVLESKAEFEIPCRISLGISRSYAALGKEFLFELASVQKQSSIPPQPITGISQATTTLTVSTLSAHNLNVGDTFSIADVLDTRLNYPALVVATVVNPFSFTSTAGPGGTIPSLTVGPFLAQGTLYFRPRLNAAENGTSMILENTNVTNASFYARADGGTASPLGGSITGNHSITIATTTSVQAINAAYTYAFQAAAQFDLICQPEVLTWFDKTTDTTTNPNIRVRREQLTPNAARKYKLQIAATNTAGVTKINNKILEITKNAGSTLATITLDGTNTIAPSASNLVIYGVRDQVNFANQATQVGVVSGFDNKIVVSFGVAPASNVSSYGGYVAQVNGGNVMSALGHQISNTIVSLWRTSNVLTLSGSTTWAGTYPAGYWPGEYVNVVGVMSGANLPVLVDGAYRVQSVSTNVMSLEPITNTISPTGDDIGSSAAPLLGTGGAVVKRCDARLHYARIYKFNRTITEVYGGFARNDATNAAPCFVTGGTIGTVSTVTGVTTVATVTTVTTVTTVATVTNVAQIGTVPANSFIFDQMHGAWGTTVRGSII